MELLRGAKRGREVARKSRLPDYPVLQLSLVLHEEVGCATQHRRSNVVRCRRPARLRVAGALNRPAHIIGAGRTDLSELPSCRRLNRFEGMTAPADPAT